MRRSSSVHSIDPYVERNISNDKYLAVKAVGDNIDAVITLESILAVMQSLYADKLTLDSLYADKVTLDSIYADKIALDSIYADKLILDSLYADKAKLDSIFADKATLDSLFADKLKLDSLYADKLTLDSLYIDKATLDSLFADKLILDSLYADKITLDRIYTSIANIDAVVADIINVDIVATNIANVNLTSGSIDNVNTVGTAIANVNTVATNVLDVGVVADNIADINTLANATTLADIIRVADDLNSLDVNGIADITIVAEDLVQGAGVSPILITSSNIVDVNTTASSIASVNTTATNITNVNTTATNITNVNTTATNIVDINTTAANIAVVGTVASNIVNVNTVGANISSVVTVAASIADVNSYVATYFHAHIDDAAVAAYAILIGQTIDEGDLYFNSTAKQMRVYDGASWSDSLTLTASSISTLTNKTLNDITNSIGANHIHFKVKATQALAAGDLLKIVGYNTGQNAFEVAKTVAQTDISVGVLDVALTIGEFGLCTNTGIEEKTDTSAFTVGDILYSAGNGLYTNIKPAGVHQVVGYVLSAKVNGAVFVEFTNPTNTYEVADATILKDADIGVTVQAYDANIVSDATYVHTDNNYVNADKTKIDFITVTEAVDLDVIKQAAATVTSAVVLKGLFNASAGTFPVSTRAGDSWIISVAGTIDGVSFAVNDRIVSISDTPSTTVYALNWHKLDYTDQVLSVAGKTGVVVLVASDVTDFDVEVANNSAVALNTAKVTNVTTNLSTTTTATTNTVVSSDGTNATLPAATTTVAGVMTGADKLKLNGIDTGAQVNVATNLSSTAGTTAGPTINSSTGTNVVIPSASGSNSGIITTGTQTFAGTKTFAGIVATGGVEATGGSGTGFSLEGGKHNFTANDGKGNFNIRVGHTSAELCTEAGRPFHMEWSTAAGTMQFNTSAPTLAVNDPVVWTEAFKMGPTGNQSIDLSVTGDITVTGTVDGVDLQLLNTAVGLNTAKVSNVSTNLGYTPSTTNGVVTSSDGTNATLPLVVAAGNAGLMTGTDKTKLDGIATGAQVNVATNLTATEGTIEGPKINSSTGTGVVIPSASATTSGIVTNTTQTFAGTKTFSSTITGAVSGNAGTATKLETARTINGVSFNGTANITVADGTKLPLTGGTVTGITSFTNVTDSTSTTTGAIKTSGGIGVAKSIYAGGNVTAYSDKRLKTNIELIPDALNKICTLSGYVYDRTDMDLRQTGVIAQEVLEVLPEAVTGSEEEMYGVNYGSMVGLLIEGIKEQQETINKLIARVEELERI